MYKSLYMSCNLKQNLSECWYMVRWWLGNLSECWYAVHWWLGKSESLLYLVFYYDVQYASGWEKWKPLISGLLSCVRFAYFFKNLNCWIKTECHKNPMPCLYNREGILSLWKLLRHWRKTEAKLGLGGGGH